MGQQTTCPKHKTPLEPDGICHQCTLERSEENAPQFAEFGKRISEEAKKKEDKEH